MIANLLKWNLALLAFDYAVGVATNIQDYCFRTNSEQFKAKCLKNEVIIMEHAKYGRMRISQCLEGEEKDVIDAFGHDPRFLGCSADVLHLLDTKCSGKNECEVRGTDEDLQRIKPPCLSALKVYLEASYDCGIVVDGDRSCQVKVTSTTQYIIPTTNRSSTKHNCGGKLYPWKLEAPLGQQIVVNLIQFGDAANNFNCQARGYILDNPAKRNTTLCTDSDERIAEIFTSYTNSLELVTSNQQQHSEGAKDSYLMQITAIGCSNVLPPVDAWLRRDGNTAIVGCYTSRQSWTLRCVDNHWIGVIGNCTREFLDLTADGKSTLPVTDKSTNALEVVVIATIISVGMMLCVGIVCVGAVCWKRYNKLYEKYSAYHGNGRYPDQKNGCMQNNQPLVSTS